MILKKLFWALLFIGGVSLFLKNGIALTQFTATPEMLLENFQKRFEPVKPLLPSGILPKPGFSEGVGPIIGKVQIEQGQVYVVHQGQTAAYQLKKNHPLFMGDLIITEEQSWIHVALHDESAFSLAPYTKLVIDKSVYNREKQERSSRLSLFFGRVRFHVALIADKHNDYEIQTPTATCSVKGADLALAVTPNADLLTSFQPFSLGRLFSISEARAAVPEFILTSLITGLNTTVSFSGRVGGVQTVGPLAVSAAANGGAALTPMTVGAAAEEVLNRLGPE